MVIPTIWIPDRSWKTVSPLRHMVWSSIRIFQNKETKSPWSIQFRKKNLFTSVERGFPVESSRYEQLEASFVHWKAGYSVRIWTCWIGEFAYPSDIIQTFWRNVRNIRCFAMVSCATRWHMSNFRPMKIDWTHAKICITRFHVVTQHCILPNFIFIGWHRYECLKKYQKMISRSLIALNFIKLCGIFRIMRDYAEKMKLCDSASTRKVMLHWSTCNANLQWYDVARKIILV